MRLRIGLLAVIALSSAACDDTSTNADVTAPQLGRVGSTREVVVTHPDDSGPGSLRAALERANRDARIRSIRFSRGLPPVRLQSSLEYLGSQALEVQGRRGSIDASGAVDGLVVSGGGSLHLRDLVIENAHRDGVVMTVPASASETVSLELSGVTVRGSGEFGVHMDDQSSGSAATLRLIVSDSRILENGFAEGIDDKDGIRVDEGGPGHIVSFISRSIFSGNAADGIEYDERDAGDVSVVVSQSHFDDNGTQPQNTDDLEDGFDIDEAGDGSIVAHFLHVTASRNFDGGIDLDEEGAGDIVSGLYRVEAIGNREDNIKFSEDADVEETPEVGDGSGGIRFRMRNVVATDSGDNGIQLEEFGVGDVYGSIVRSRSADNADDGVNIDQQDEGTGAVWLRASTFEGNADKDVNIDNVELVVRD